MTKTMTLPVEVLECLIDASIEVRNMLAAHPKMQGSEYVSLGMALNSAIKGAKRAFDATPEPVSDPYKLGDGEVLQWFDGVPENFRRGEWFIALTAWNDRVCLKALPEEYSYDFTTADGTYIKTDKIVKWMPFPDSEFRHPAQPEAQKGEPVAWIAMWGDGSTYGEPQKWPPIDGSKTYHGMMGRTVQPLYTQPAPSSDELLAEWAELQRLAEAASPGPWKACATIYKHMNCEIRTGAKGEGQPIGQIWDGPNAFADGQFIAAASPQAVLKLIAIAKHKGPQS